MFNKTTTAQLNFKQKCHAFPDFVFIYPDSKVVVNEGIILKSLFQIFYL